MTNARTEPAFSPVLAECSTATNMMGALDGRRPPEQSLSVIIWLPTDLTLLEIDKAVVIMLNFSKTVFREPSMILIGKLIV